MRVVLVALGFGALVVGETAWRPAPPTVTAGAADATVERDTQKKMLELVTGTWVYHYVDHAGVGHDVTFVLSQAQDYRPEHDLYVDARPALIGNAHACADVVYTKRLIAPAGACGWEALMPLDVTILAGAPHGIYRGGLLRAGVRARHGVELSLRLGDTILDAAVTDGASKVTWIRRVPTPPVPSTSTLRRIAI